MRQKIERHTKQQKESKGEIVMFLGVAAKKATDVRGFLREAAGNNSIKYKAEAGKKHILYFPYSEVDALDEDGKPVLDANGNPIKTKQLISIFGEIHDRIGNDGRYAAQVCLKDRDGSCPFCDRVADSWDIYKYRIELEERTCGKKGDELAKHIASIKGSFADDRKVKATKPYIYILTAQFRTNDRGDCTIDKDGLPEYDLKVLKWSSSRAERINQQLENSKDTLAGCELILEYPNEEDLRLVVSQSTSSPIFPNNRLTTMHPKLAEKINSEAEKFEWDGVEKAYPEWESIEADAAQKLVASAFEEWDAYKVRRESWLKNPVGPEPMYLEYGGGGAGEATQPPITGVQMPQLPQNGASQTQMGVQMPGTQGSVGVDVSKMPDLNSMFGSKGTTPTV